MYTLYLLDIYVNYPRLCLCRAEAYRVPTTIALTLQALPTLSRSGATLVYLLETYTLSMVSLELLALVKLHLEEKFL